MNKIYVFGDLHGSHKPIKNFYDCYKDHHDFNFDGTDTIILLGDSGLNYYFNHRDDNFKNALSKYPFNYFVIRGNHEERPSICAEKEPEKWKTEIFWDNEVYVEKRCPKIKYALDVPAYYQIPTRYMHSIEMGEDKMIDVCARYYDVLVVPGAYSVDKEYRLMNGWSWFSQEQLSLKEMFDGLKVIEENYGDFDIVLSHTCPVKYEPVDLFLTFIDQSKVDKSMEVYLDYIDDMINYDLWIWGHYHTYRYYDPETWEEDGGDRRKLMLFNDNCIDLDEWMNTTKEGAKY